ncbi:MAG: Hsp20/alpha crystallin family protein [Clostridia bacterium]|nr:Hsp20/alpha crystallin family protein [Clostridia bacterium]MBQ2518288.1 Hsp20/alpha crystallin family protein [Clostridia bacterium]
MFTNFFGDSIFDDLMDFTFPAMRELESADRKLYGKHAAHVMRTDVREHDDGYEVDIDLPGFKKEEISLELENGNLTVTAAKGLDKDEKDAKGKLIRCERYSGTMQRSFFVGKNLTEEDIKAKFEDGVLTLTVPKKEQPKLPDKKTIMIEG